MWVPCVLNQDRVKDGDSVVTFGSIYTGNYSYMGPPITEWNQGETGIAIKSSVGKFGGFYIAKYESGILGTKDNFTLYNENGILTPTTSKPLSQQGKGVWNNISQSDAEKISKLMLASSTEVKSDLISGECWDTTLQWIKNTNDSTYDENSQGKGNYDEDANTNNWKGKITTTGSLRAYEKNNIYDMAGNALEWTTEYGTFNGTNYFVSRGGFYKQKQEEIFSASRRLNGTGNGSNYDQGFRVVLYKEASNS